jgi:hypothetical protein
VASPGWCFAERGQLREQFCVVVYLSIENDNIATTGRLHGLVARWAQVENGEAAVSKRYRPLEPGTSVIWAARPNPFDHGTSLETAVDGAVELKETSNSTHGVF